MERLTDRNFRIGFGNSDKLPNYVSIYEKLREYENKEEDKEASVSYEKEEEI